MDEWSGLSHWEGEWSYQLGNTLFRLRHMASRSLAKLSSKVERNRVLPARGIGEIYARGLGEDKILTPWYPFTEVWP